MINLKATGSELIRRACSKFAWVIDKHLEGHGMGFFYEDNCGRTWWHLDMFRDVYSWTVHLGKFDLIWDRPAREERV